MKNETCHFYMPHENKQASKDPISKVFVHPQHPLISYVVQCEFKGRGFEKKESNKIQVMPKTLQTWPTSATQENQIARASAVGHYGFRNISNQSPIATLEIQTVWAPIDFIHVLQCEFKGCGLKKCPIRSE